MSSKRWFMVTVTATLFGINSIMIGATALASSGNIGVKEQKPLYTVKKDEKLVTIKVKVPGMTCEGCAQSITGVLLKHHYLYPSVNIDTKWVEAKLEKEAGANLKDPQWQEHVKKKIAAVIETAGSQYQVTEAVFE